MNKPRLDKDLQFRTKTLFTTVQITNNGRLDQRLLFKNDILKDYFESGVHTLRWVTTDAQRHRELKTPPEPLHDLWEGQCVWYIEFGALQLACIPDLAKWPQNESKSWQENFALFAFANKQKKTAFLAIYIIWWHREILRTGGMERNEVRPTASYVVIYIPCSRI